MITRMLTKWAQSVLLIVLCTGFAIGLTTALLAGCLADPAGMTTRTEIRARAQIESVRLQTEAQKYTATQETVRAGIMAATAPWVTLIIMGGLVVAIVVWWQGRIWHTRTTLLLTQPPQPRLPRQPGLADLMLLAQRQGYQIEIENQVGYLVDQHGQRVGQRMLTGEKLDDPCRT